MSFTDSWFFASLIKDSILFLLSTEKSIPITLSPCFNTAGSICFFISDLLIDEKNKRELRKRLTTYSQELKSKSKEMWELIFDEIS